MRSMKAAFIATVRKNDFHQKRFATKVVAGSMKGKIVKNQAGFSLTKRNGWKVYPGGLVTAGSAVYKVKACEGISMDEDDDEIPWSIYNGLNTIRNKIGIIKATVDGVVRMSKLPGTEGSADKVFLWVDPHWKDFYNREMRRHKYRTEGIEFAVDEVESRFMRNPKWSNLDIKTEELPNWRTHPEWFMEKSERRYKTQPMRSEVKPALTERQLYEKSDHDMYYSKMPNRKRSYKFGGKRHDYKGVQVEMNPYGNGGLEFGRFNWETPDVLGRRESAPRIDRTVNERNRYQKYTISPMHGTFWI
eukprot:TRINITY_DN9598_c2_g1_i1.p1 TRINITY_DN9598_c2_g1~~TRINITY_DN9598_c2_g1_i1.p1  ORF type:complete len:303 (+),score=48.13 TRINITY_DN9598_c2_g1_i1:67-975(+)